jgi:ABC-type bacteriocin/lantibiotic exporter with double-glycine peptidase domain
LFLLSLRGSKRDLTWGVLASIAVGVIGLSIPLATALVFDEIVPNAETSRLIGITIVLVSLAVAAGLFAYMSTYQLIRVSDSMEMITGGAVLDRVRRLPASALRQWSSAALASRILLASTLQTALNDAVTVGLLALVLTVLNAILMVVLIPSLGTVAVTIGALLIVVMLLFVRLESRRKLEELERLVEVDEVTLDLLRGWLPVRMTDGEVAGFGRWAAAYAGFRSAFNRRWAAEIQMEIFRVGVFSAALLAFVVVATMVPVGSITSASFLAFLSSFGQFSAGVTGLMITIRSMALIAPSVTRLAPLLAIEPEVDVRREDPGELRGAVEVRSLGFRYGEDHPWVLRDVSFRAEPGSFVAVVGTSGSGKSTLLRLLLGFETPRAGVVMYDDSDLAALDVEAVRRQFGVVLQSSLLLPGTIRENVTISTGGIPDSRVWELLANVRMDDAVRAMPQGLDTIIDEGSSLVSGGQRQRILLARALANSPTVLFLDEATSALDNITQETVTRSIAELGVTRIVIAHRLSTIRQADLIVVLDGGIVVQQGTYDELVARDGLFASLVERQEL